MTSNISLPLGLLLWCWHTDSPQDDWQMLWLELRLNLCIQESHSTYVKFSEAYQLGFFLLQYCNILAIAIKNWAGT